MKVILVSVGGDVRASEISLQLPTVVGRGREAVLTLPHPLVSRRHCELYERDGKLRVRDLGSLNGTYVGSQQVKDAEVPPGELLTVATLNFRVVYGEVPADDEKESPLLVGNDDSTHGPGRTPMIRARQRLRRPRPPRVPARLASAPVDRRGRLWNAIRNGKWARFHRARNRRTAKIWAHCSTDAASV